MTSRTRPDPEVAGDPVEADDAPSASGTTIDERKAAVLRAVVERYVATAQPVGSGTVARAGRLGVSSATVRNDMTILEREGYLVQPHTSAGRVPTDLGYRFFVDHFAADGQVPAGTRRAVSEFFAGAHHALEDLLHETSHLLARLTDHAAVVVGPPAESAVVRSAQIVALQPRVLLVVAVLSNGSVEKQTLTLDADTDDATVAAASAILDAALRGAAVTGLPVPPAAARGACDAAASDLARRGAEALAAHAGQHEDLVYVGGASRLAAEQSSFSAADRAERLLELIEEQVAFASLLHVVLDADVTVRIGSENEAEELQECSLVLAPYPLGDSLGGTVGVFGPTRMDYRRALAAVAVVASRLGERLSG